jgi:hypothetical protein
LSCTADVAGTWIAEIRVWAGTVWLTYNDTVVVSEVPPPQEGLATITGVDKPSAFTPGVEFFIRAWIKNIGDVTDILFMNIYNTDTNEMLCMVLLKQVI